MYLIIEIDEMANDKFVAKKESYLEALQFLYTKYPYMRKIGTELYKHYIRTVFQADIGSNVYFAIMKIEKGDDFQCHTIS